MFELIQSVGNSFSLNDISNLVPDGNKGDLTVSANGLSWIVNNNAITNAKIDSVAWSKITGTPTTLSGYGITDGITSASVAAGYQPLDSDLTAIAALSTTSFGRGLLTEASSTTARSTLGLGTLATVSPTGTPDGTKFLRDDNSWQAVNLSAIANNSVLGNVSGSTATPIALNATQLRTLQGLATTDSVTFGAVAAYGTSAPIQHAMSVGSSASVTLDSVFGFPGIWFTGPATSRTVNNYSFLAVGGQTIFNSQSGNTMNFRIGNGEALAISSGRRVLIGSTLPVDDGASALQVNGNLTASGTLRVNNTFTDASNYERGKIEWSSNVLRIGTEKAGTGSARALELQTDGTTRLTIGTNGNVGIGVTNPNAKLVIQDNNAADLLVYTAVAGNANISVLATGGACAFNLDTSAVSANRILGGLGGYPNLLFQTGQNSSTYVSVLRLTTTNAILGDGIHLEVGTTTGTKIGTATNQKLGFFNKTPVVQPTAVADATDAASVITQLNALLSRIRDLGLIAT